MKIRIKLLGIEFQLHAKKKKTIRKTSLASFDGLENPKLNFGPGPNWTKPGNDWYSVDVDPDFGDVVVDFQKFEHLPFKDNSIACVYGSHVFEHMSIFKSPRVFSEIYRVLKKDGIFRLVFPDAAKSIKEYLDGNMDFELFKRRYERTKKKYNKELTLFECMREDFISPSGQPGLLGENALAHQNAWDFETMRSDLITAGFDPQKIKRMSFKQSQSEYFSFEGTYPSEANEDYRSLYVEAIK